jgi:aspartyl-tRNA(Asn)/glutamyl-tRNA(Gln) amidotransferase subunit B
MRSKEESHDYRYFPEPDLVPLAPTEQMLREAREALPELPAARIARYVGLGLAEDVAATLATDPATAEFFERTDAAAAGIESRAVANWVTGELAAALRQGEDEVAAADSKVEPVALASLIALVQEKKISHGSGKTVLASLVAEGGDPAAIVEREGLAQIADSGELESIVAAAVEANPKAAEEIKAGNPKAIGAIVGAVMKETKGRADGGEVNRLIREKLGL